MKLEITEKEAAKVTQEDKSQCIQKRKQTSVGSACKPYSNGLRASLRVGVGLNKHGLRTIIAALTHSRYLYA